MRSVVKRKERRDDASENVIGARPTSTTLIYNGFPLLMFTSIYTVFLLTWVLKGKGMGSTLEARENVVDACPLSLCTLCARVDFLFQLSPFLSHQNALHAHRLRDTLQ